MPELSLGFSPCPNDTFIFFALAKGKVDTGGLKFGERIEDVETLNRLAIKGNIDISKVSYGAFGELRDNYCLLRSGGALGRGCGPLVVARTQVDMLSLRGRRIAIPGRLTTAFMLLRLFDPELGLNAVEMPFDRIMGAVRDGEVDAGLIIHEGRFTYPSYGLTSLLDLGQWWEEVSGGPIPLGCIVARRGLGAETAAKAEALIRQSVLYAMKHPHEPDEFIRAHAQEMAVDVISQHIALYVNGYSVDLGEDGLEAVRKLFEMAEQKGIIERSNAPIFI